jgi:hypothetical protein
VKQKPRDIKSLLTYLAANGLLRNKQNNLLTQWGPKNRRMLSTIFLPPRLVDNNQDTIDDVRFRVVAAQDGTRHSPAQIVDGGEMFSKINYRLGHSDLARQITGPDYDAINKFLRGGNFEAAIGKVVGIFSTFIIQALVEHDELANWEAIQFNKISRRGNNAYYEYEDGPDLENHRVAAGGDWSDPDYDPYVNDIIPRARLLTSLGFDIGGIRPVTTQRVMELLADHPATLRRAYLGPAPVPGQTLEEVAVPTDQSDVARVFRKIGMQAPITHDLRIQTKTGEKRAFAEGHMTMIASTGRVERVNYNVDDPTQVKVVRDGLGFNGIGTPNNAQGPGRRNETRAETNRKDARIELEGWQATGPVIQEPTAIADVFDIL